MNLAQLKSSVPIKRLKRKIVGRGESSGHGKTSSRGHRGQGQRSGYSHRAYFEGGQMSLIRKIPKRGFSRGRFHIEVALVNVESLNRFAEKDLITPAKLQETGLVKGAFDKIKVLGKGELKKTGLTVQAHCFSKNAAAKIQQLGGQAIVLGNITGQTDAGNKSKVTETTRTKPVQP